MQVNLCLLHSHRLVFFGRFLCLIPGVNQLISFFSHLLVDFYRFFAEVLCDGVNLTRNFVDLSLLRLCQVFFQLLNLVLNIDYVLLGTLRQLLCAQVDQFSNFFVETLALEQVRFP